jgi:hypothetical protein
MECDREKAEITFSRANLEEHREQSMLSVNVPVIKIKNTAKHTTTKA